MYAWTTWWAQYEGIDNFNNFLKGVNEDGVYTVDIFGQQGRVEALETVHDMLYSGTDEATSNGYVKRQYRQETFTSAQLKFLNGESFFICNGDWMEREASSNSSADFSAFLRTPILSSIIDVLPDKSVADDDRLRDAIDYIDYKNGDLESDTPIEKPSWLSADDLAYLETARSMVCTEGEAHVTYIPAYSDNVEGAKEFLRYWLSKKGQNLQMTHSYGNTAPLKIDYTALERYSELSLLQVSKLDIWTDARFVGRKYNTPMTYNGGLTTFNTKIAPENAFGVDTTSTSYRTAEDYVIDEINYFYPKWGNMMTNAGVNN